MPQATITTSNVIKTSPFKVGVTFDMAIDTLPKSIIVLRTIAESGVTSVDFSVTGSRRGWMLNFTLPTSAEGTFEITIMGEVQITGMSGSEAVIVTSPLVVHYDTTTNVDATFGEVAYNDEGEIVLPVTFAEAVIVPSKTVFPVSRVSGDALDGMTYTIRGSNRKHELVFVVPPDRKGEFQVTADGDVLKKSTMIWDNIVLKDKNDMVVDARTVAYNTIVPRIVDFDVPASYALGSPVDVRVAYNIIVTGWHANNTITNPGIFELEGANLGSPLPYKWGGSSAPDFDEPVPANLEGTDWQLLDTPPGGQPTAENDFADDGTWHGVSGQYFLIRFPDPQEVGIFNLRERIGIVRGPVR